MTLPGDEDSSAMAEDAQSHASPSRLATKHIAWRARPRPESRGASKLTERVALRHVAENALGRRACRFEEGRP